MSAPLVDVGVRTPRLVLRATTLDDAEDLLAVHADPEVFRYGGAPLASLEAMRDKLARDLGTVVRGEAVLWSLRLVGAARAIGYTGLYHWSQRDQRAEVGYALAREAWGQGLMREALPAMLRFGFTRMRLRRVEAACDPRNAASVRLLARCGFVREGLRRERSRCLDGTWGDLAVFGLLEREAPASLRGP